MHLEMWASAEQRLLAAESLTPPPTLPSPHHHPPHLHASSVPYQWSTGLVATMSTQ
jgi:hypothetical protein